MYIVKCTSKIHHAMLSHYNNLYTMPYTKLYLMRMYRCSEEQAAVQATPQNRDGTLCRRLELL